MLLFFWDTIYSEIWKVNSGLFWDKMNSEIFSYLEFHTVDEEKRAQVRSCIFYEIKVLSILFMAIL